MDLLLSNACFNAEVDKVLPIVIPPIDGVRMNLRLSVATTMVCSIDASGQGRDFISHEMLGDINVCMKQIDDD